MRDFAREIIYQDAELSAIAKCSELFRNDVQIAGLPDCLHDAAITYAFKSCA